MGLLPLDPSRIGQMCRVGCCLVVGSCCESRVVLCELRVIPAIHKDTLWCVAAFTAAGTSWAVCFAKAGTCRARVNGAYERLASLPFEAGSFALPAVELRFAGSTL